MYFLQEKRLKDGPLSLKPQTPQRQTRWTSVWRSRKTPFFLLAALSLAAWMLCLGKHDARLGWRKPDFYHNVTAVHGICGATASHAGHIGLHGDSAEFPKRSFFWYFEAEEDAAHAPLILTIGGGPGTSAMMNTLWGQSPCLATEHGLVPNPHRWTERHNLVALDHPVGAGFSYGTHVNNSRSAAYDVYDFLQKFFILYPHLARNKFVISGGSYGGVYVPNIATVIHEQNLLLAGGHGMSGAVHINLDALILSNPLSNPTAHFSWTLNYRCVEHQLYNSTQCAEYYSRLPACLDALEMAYTVPTRDNRIEAGERCGGIHSGDLHGVNQEDIRKTCIPKPDDPAGCHPEFAWVNSIFEDERVRGALGLPRELAFSPLNMEVNAEFSAEGDLWRQHHLLYPPLLEAGIRLLHYIGAKDANCAWPGIFSFLKLLETPFQADFLTAPDVPWLSAPTSATVRTVGPGGAGSMAYIRVEEAGHFTVKDQPALAKVIVERWIANESFL